MEKLQGLPTKPCPRSDLVESEEVIGQHLFLYDESTQLVHALNSGAAVIWYLCDGERDVGSIAGEIAQAYGQPRQEVLAQVRETVAKFQMLGLMETPGNDS